MPHWVIGGAHLTAAQLIPPPLPATLVLPPLEVPPLEVPAALPPPAPLALAPLAPLPLVPAVLAPAVPSPPGFPLEPALGPVSPMLELVEPQAAT